MTTASAANPARSNHYPDVHFDPGYHRVRGEICNVSSYDPETCLATFSVEDQESGRRLQLVGRFESPTVGTAVHFEQVRYGRDEVRKRYAYYLTAEAVRLDPAAAIMQGLRNLSPQDAPVRFDPLAIKRLPLDRRVLTEYLAEHMPGVEAAGAARLIAAFDPEGELNLLEALDNCTEAQFRARTGFGEVAVRALLSEWRSAPREHRADVALRSLGLNRRQAKAALERALKSMLARSDPSASPPAADPLRAAYRICQHPYRLTLIEGIDFPVADAAAKRLGMAPDCDQRIAACAREALTLASRSGDTYMPLYELAERTAYLLDDGGREQRRPRNERRPPPTIDPVRIARLIWNIDPSEEIVFPLGRSGAHDPVSLKKLADAEAFIARNVCMRLASPIAKPVVVPSRTELEAIVGHPLDPKQVTAVQRALSSNLPVTTGGPGTGKTSIQKATLQILENHGLRVLQAAPTGRAARRQSEATGRPSDTIHRVLGSKGADNGFLHDEHRPIAGDGVTLDEGSMSDVLIAASFLRAIPLSTRLLINGDVDQLSSVGPGNFLGDLIASGVPPVSRLTKTFRQKGDDNPIIELGRNIRDGIAQLPKSNSQALQIKPCRDKDATARSIIATVIELRDAGVDPDDMVVLTPMLKGACGVNALNAQIQRLLNPDGRRGLKIGGEDGMGEGVKAGPGDRVMQRSNDKSLLLANGDVGTVLRYGRDRRSLIVDFGLGEVEISGYKLQNLQLAYACTIHKSQGSEYKHVIMALSPEHKIMMRRNLLYTGVTRAKEFLYLVGDLNVLYSGVHQVQDSQRRTLLQPLLRRMAFLLKEQFTPDEATIVVEPLPDFRLDLIRAPH